jgi:transposase InsO family protein
MFENDALTRWCARNNLTEQARKKIEQIRNSQPIRHVQSGRGNVSGRYPSKKMGRTIQFESHRNELAAIYEYEHDKLVCEFYDQPSRLKLNYEGVAGKRICTLHTPDFLVIRDNAVGWEECKTEEELRQLAERSPNRYYKDQDGTWRCPPGEVCAEQYGFYYLVKTDKGINWTYQRNINFLEDYLLFDVPPVSDESRHVVCELVSAQPNITLQELYLKTNSQVSKDDVHTLLAEEEIYVDLYAALLCEPERVRVFPNKANALAFSHVVQAPKPSAVDRLRFLDLSKTNEIVWDDHVWTLMNVGEELVGLLSGNGAFKEIPLAVFEELFKRGRITGHITQSLMPSLPPEAMGILVKSSRATLEAANERAAIVQSYLRAELTDSPDISFRTLRTWVSQYRLAEAKYGCGYIGLIPKPRSGNGNIRLDQATCTLLNKFIENEYETLKQKRKYEVYGAFLLACEREEVTPASYKTFCKFIKRCPRFEQVTKRQGRRAAYPYKPFYWTLDQTTPRHGDRPFEIAHIDHTQLDEEFVCSVTGRNLGRAWASIMVDAYSRRFLAVYVTFESPSYRSCMMLIRECVRRFGRLPQTIVVDGGVEFESTYFETLLARYQCTKKTRPPAESRFGSVCERLFGTINTRFLNNLQGNTQIMRNVRQVTKSVNPKNHAIWTLGSFYSRFKEFAYEVYDTLHHATLGCTPREMFALGMRQSGNRAHRIIPYNEDFLMFTLPTTIKGTAKVCASRGMKIHGIYYWSGVFRDPEIERSSVEIRYDPFDAGVAYAFVRGIWVKCHSEYYSVLRNRSEREIKVATEELRRRRKLQAQQFNITAKKLAEFLESVEAEELLLTQRLRAREAQQALTHVNEKPNDNEPPTESDTPIPQKPGASRGEGKKASRNGASKLKDYGRF